MSNSSPVRYYVLDACALIAFLRREPGAALVDTLLTDTETICLVHAINLCEVYYDILRSDGSVIAKQSVEDIMAVGVEVREDLDSTFWQQVGDLKVNPGKLSLADCFAIALALRTNAAIVTSDHHEFDPIDSCGLVPFYFIR